MRRYFYEAQAKDVARATVVLAYVGLLYDVEREARDRHLNADQRLALRQSKSRPILDDIKNYLEAEKPKVLPKRPIEDAIDYTLKGWPALLWYCQDGDLEIDKAMVSYCTSFRGLSRGCVNREHVSRHRVKWEQRVSATGVPFAQDAIRKRLIATAVMTCCKRVLTRPR